MDLNRLTIDDKVTLLEFINRQKKNFQEPNDFREFLIECKLILNPQSYGARIQNRWIRDHLYEPVSSSLNLGDYTDSSLYVEFKCSYISNDGWTLLQLRPYQSIHRYDILLIDDKYNHTLYKIPKESMEDLIKKYGGACHGTKDSNILNTNIEYRMGIQKTRLHEFERYKSETTTETNGKFF